jgi:hypothetical protein
LLQPPVIFPLLPMDFFFAAHRPRRTARFSSQPKARGLFAAAGFLAVVNLPIEFRIPAPGFGLLLLSRRRQMNVPRFSISLAAAPLVFPTLISSSTTSLSSDFVSSCCAHEIGLHGCSAPFHSLL